jgi:hypothetical protein
MRQPRIHSLGWEDNIKMGFKEVECECVDCIHGAW